ncbi:MAG: isomerizing glutamine--fructose-6-phosphate transaminase [Terriglobales bacterium]
MTALGNFPHYMLKEIYDQPRAVMDAIAHYLPPESQRQTLDGVRLSDDQVQAIQKINIVASGASRHAGMVGEFIFERMARVSVEVDFASQYCYRDPFTAANELTVLLSQSGTTKDTLLAQREAKAKGAKTLAICNVKDAPITLESDGNIYTHAGEEVSIAATKSFTAQLVALFALGVHLGHVRRTITAEETREHLRELMALPEKVEAALTCNTQCNALAAALKNFDTFMFLGRDISYPIALEGALKLKETSYIHAEGYPTGEMKHGPNALVDEHLPVVMIITKDADASSALRYEKSVALLDELVKKGARVVVVCNQDDAQIKSLTKDVILIPQVSSYLSPVLEIIPLQLFAYHVAVMRGVDVDRPRNLSKSVITE